ncbi:MAG: hypothetical protein EHM35_03980 [Planctomycetaceae bacterium]|jgi:hypothetical protein|nr:MAG: hypothetical protein EHM35_03980 [Planctomycetaceae bacterium]
MLDELDELDELINKFIDKFVLPLPRFIFYLPYIAAMGVQGFGLTIRVWFCRRQTNLIQQRQLESDAQLRALGMEPDDDRTP